MVTFDSRPPLGPHREKSASEAPQSNWDDLHVIECVLLPAMRTKLRYLLRCLEKGHVPPKLLRQYADYAQTVFGREMQVDWERVTRLFLMHKAQLRRRADWILSGKTHDEYAEDDDIAEIEAMSQIEYQDRQNSINSEAQKNQLQLQRAAQKGVNSRHGNEKREEEARQRILEAAQALKTRGESVSISALAREGSLSRNTVRKYKTLVDSLVKH